MFYSKVVNLPNANTAYLIRTLLTALDPNAPLVLPSATVRAVSSNSGSVAMGDASMTAATDGNELAATEAAGVEGGDGIVLDTSSTYLIASTNDQKVLIQGRGY
jgi:hypothetical protein